MTQQEISILLSGGIDAESALNLLMNKEKIYRKYLYRFTDDNNFETFSEAIKNKDLQAAFRTVHTLKGTASNVGALTVAGIADELTEILRPLQEELKGADSGIKETDEILRTHSFDFSRLAAGEEKLRRATDAAKEAIRQVQALETEMKEQV